jgi:hypothetical protein
MIEESSMKFYNLFKMSEMPENDREWISEMIFQQNKEDSGYDIINTGSNSFEKLCNYISWLMESRMDFLLSLMYRLDVTEKSIKEALHPSNPANPVKALAELIIQRQLDRIKTKEKYRVEIDDRLKGMEW